MFGITLEEGETKTARPSDMWMWNGFSIPVLMVIKY